jgi:hypothetical protein
MWKVSIPVSIQALASNQLVSPFGKVEVERRKDGSARVRAFVQVERRIENAKTGLALDGSASMRPAYGFASGLMGALFSNRRSGINQVSQEARRLCRHLAQVVDVDQKTATIYWGTGARSEGVEPVGELSGMEAARFEFGGPRQFGGGTTALLPAVRYFVDRFPAASWGVFLFVTDGVFRDLDAVRQLSLELAGEIVAGRRRPVRLLAIGVGDQIDEAQLRALASLRHNLWSYGIARNMSNLAEIALALVDDSLVVADSGAIRDAQGAIVRDYRDTGLPALMTFELPAGAAQAFVLETGGTVIRQPLPA